MLYTVSSAPERLMPNGVGCPGTSRLFMLTGLLEGLDCDELPTCISVEAGRVNWNGKKEHKDTQHSKRRIILQCYIIARSSIPYGILQHETNNNIDLMINQSNT